MTDYLRIFPQPTLNRDRRFSGQFARKRIPLLYTANIYAVDPNDASNRQALSKALLRAACACNCISAHRAPDDETQKESAVIGRVLENLFATAKADETDLECHGLAKDLEQAVKTIQDKLGEDFNTKLNELLPALALFGYPGLKDPKLITETTFKVEGLLTNHTKVRYLGSSGVNLPETYNGSASAISSSFFCCFANTSSYSVRSANSRPR